ncbi:MAG TPA: hypothetical protein VFV83_00755 [Chthoniobacteraceae bacterium]|nr:hypothetical protein [Chthoniobacteraceae bacterium]
MRKLALVGTLFAVSFCTAGIGAEAVTALAALRLLPKGESKNLARIEGIEGTPAPERWHILVHDKDAENGVREYVIAGGAVVASRSISQFAPSLAESDIIPAENIKFDSSRAAQLAQDYAMANKLMLASINYRLCKQGAGAAPLWRVTCLDEEGRELGALVLTAEKGNVVSHDGFAFTPTSANPELFTPETTSQIAGEESTREGAAATTKSRHRTKRRKPKEDPGIFRRIGGKMQKFFTGKDTISH